MQIQNQDNFSNIQPQVAALVPSMLDQNLNQVHHPAMVILQRPEEEKQRACRLGNLKKVITIPISILKYPFSRIAASAGLGLESEIRLLDENRRKILEEMGGESIQFGFDGEARLEGMFFSQQAPLANAKTILLCTGSHQSFEHYAVPMVEALLSMGHHVMAFNYEGYGLSEGIASEQGVYRSVEAAYQYLVQNKNRDDKSIVAWGYSLGSGAVVDLASKHNDIDIVIDRGFSSMSQAAYQQAPKGLKSTAKVIFKVGSHFDNLSKLAQVPGNVFIAQGNRDNGMNYEEHGYPLQQAIRNNPNATFKIVNSAHLHQDNNIWFSRGEDRLAVERYLVS